MSYVRVGPAIDAGTDEGDELMAPLVDDKTANWRKHRKLLSLFIVQKKQIVIKPLQTDFHSFTPFFILILKSL